MISRNTLFLFELGMIFNVDADELLAAMIGRQHLDWGLDAHELADDAKEESGQLRETAEAELDGLYVEHVAALNSDGDEVIAMTRALGAVLDLIRCCTACENRATPKATFHVAVEQHHLPRIACLL